MAGKKGMTAKLAKRGKVTAKKTSKGMSTKKDKRRERTANPSFAAAAAAAEISDDDEDAASDLGEVDLSNLAALDPSFMSYLQKEDPSLIEELRSKGPAKPLHDASEEYLSGSDINEESAAGEEDMEEQDGMDNDLEEDLLKLRTSDAMRRKKHVFSALETHQTFKEKRRPITRPLVKQWEAQLTSGNNKPLVAVKAILVGYKTLAHIFSPTTIADTTMYTLGHGNSLNALFNLCINTLPYHFDALFGFDRTESSKLLLDFKPYSPRFFDSLNDDDNDADPESHLTRRMLLPKYHTGRWTEAKPLLSTWINLSLLVLNLSNPVYSRMLLRALEHAAPYLLCFPKLLKKMYPIVFEHWANSEKDQKSSLLAFFLLRKLCLLGGEAHLNHVLRSAYLVYVGAAGKFNRHTAASLKFMESCLIELFSFDNTLSYQYMYVYLRQLAYTLRMSQDGISAEKKDPNEVYNWRYLCSLLFLTRLVCVGMTKDPATQATYQLLVFPLTQVLIATMNLTTSARYFPARLHILTAMNAILKSIAGFIPMLHYIGPMISSKHILCRPKPDLPESGQFKFAFRASKGELGTHSFQRQVISGIYLAILTYLGHYGESMSFPELAIPVIAQLRALLPQLQRSQHAFYTDIRQFIEIVKDNIAYIVAKRNSKLLGASSSAAAAQSSQTSPLANYHQRWLDLNKDNVSPLHSERAECYDKETLFGKAGQAKEDHAELAELEREARELLDMRFKRKGKPAKAIANRRNDAERDSDIDESVDDGYDDNDDVEDELEGNDANSPASSDGDDSSSADEFGMDDSDKETKVRPDKVQAYTFSDSE